jgi:hypothetical protein
MSYALQRAVWQNGPTERNQFNVLQALADYADDDGGNIFPSIPTLAAKCRMSDSTAIRALDGLVKDGWITRKRRKNAVNTYQIIVAKLSGYVILTQPETAEPLEDVNLTPLDMSFCNPGYVILTPDPITITNHKEEEEEEPPSPAPPIEPPIEPAVALREHFVKRTAIQPNDRTGVYDRDWQQPLGQLLALAGGDAAAAVALLDRALAVARGDNERRKTYTVSCPRSLLGIASNLAATQQTAATVADDDTIWQRALAAVTRRDFTDERLKAAIRAIGGTGRIASANGHDTETLKRSLGHAYRNVAAA